MKIAFVNQPIDVVLPPFQTSVGACTYGVAIPLAKRCDVVIYALKDRQSGAILPEEARGVSFRLIPSVLTDRILFQARSKLARCGLRLAPDSTSEWQFPHFGLQVAADLRSRNVDIIHLQHCSQYAPIIRAYNPGARIVLHLHSEWFSQNAAAPLNARLAVVDLVTGVSDYVARKIRAAFPSAASICETTYNGIDPNEFGREPVDCPKPAHSGVRILYAGAVSPHKGIHVLLAAFEILLRSFRNISLDVVGVHATYSRNETFDRDDTELLETVARFYKPHFLERLKARMTTVHSDAGTYVGLLKTAIGPAACPKVRFLGLIPRADLVNAYYEADIFAFPSVWNEGFGIPPVEAMAAGVPVVATRSGGVPETVLDGATGIVVEKNDPHALASALATLIENHDLRRKMGRAGRARVLSHFTWERVAEGMYARYKDLCDSPAVRLNSTIGHA